MQSASVHPSGLKEILETHLACVESRFVPGPVTDWAREFLRRFRTEDSDPVCLVAAGKMAESLARGERHGVKRCSGDSVASIETFPCGVEEARQAFYPDGYFPCLRLTLPAVREVNPGCHFVHVQFFCDRRNCSAQFTLVANGGAGGDLLCSSPVDLLTAEERRQTSFRMGHGAGSHILLPQRVPPEKPMRSTGIGPASHRLRAGWRESAAPTRAPAKVRPTAHVPSRALEDLGCMDGSTEAHPSALRDVLERHLSAVESDSRPGPAREWLRGVLHRFRAEHLVDVCTLGAGKMAESLVDGKGHGISLLKPDFYVSISTFPCGLLEARRKHYKGGYFDHLGSILHDARQVNPGCHCIHVLFFYDHPRCRVQFTLIPDYDTAGGHTYYALPFGLLTPEERRQVGIE